jgi:nicotinate dehydrogenase subunit A
MAITLNVNGAATIVDAPAETKLLYVLRNDLRLNGAKYGCGLGQCGACTVLVDGAPIRSCITEAGAVAGARVETIEGLAQGDRLHPVQRAMLAEQAAQCGYCSAGIVMAAVALLRQTREPTDTQIKQALDDNLCRCGSQARVVRAIKRAVREGSR